MRLAVVTPSGTLCDTDTEQVSLPGAMGAFTVLAGHAPLIAHLRAGTILYTAQGEQAEIEIESGFVRVYRDRIDVCAETVSGTQKENR